MIVSTSTPHSGLAALVERHGARLHVHAPNRGIGADWNAALAQADSLWTTIAHQDDVYDPLYASTMLAYAQASPDTLIVFCQAEELREGGPALTPHMRVKRALTELAFMGRPAISSARARRRLLSLGNPVVCPSVMINLRALPGFRFREDLRSNLDWAAWLELSSRTGQFLYLREALVAQRTHAHAETTATIASGVRRSEDRRMFESIWPAPIARLIASVYELGYRNRRGLDRREGPAPSRD